MSRTGNEMINELSKLLGSEMVKTAAEKEDKKEEKEKAKEEKEEAKAEEKAAKEEEKAEKKEEKEKGKKDKKDKKKKKAEVMMGVINDLVKLANELDASGADDASGLVDDAIKVIMENIEKSAHFEDGDPTPEELGVELAPDSMPEGMGFGAGETKEDEIDKLLSDPATKELIKNKLGL
jgi:hypothetical protein